ncbi:CAP64-like protein [Favolaschia claudopus]|uniref:CAP64-like protein n=1 Tax=Favolaschia claudopus TaxID=2862362 RepID=A0AAW0CTS6_9AGAR
MQRRSSSKRGEPYIAPPVLSRHPSNMGSDNDKVSRLSQRTFGVTNRIWLILSLFLFLITFTHYIVPIVPSSATPTYTFSNLNLTPRNYLNASEASPNPFEFCPVYGPGDEIGLKHGAVTLGKTRLHLGSGARIQRVLNKALTGQPVTISIIGGSVSACHGAGDDPIAPKCYPSRFFQWWNTVFPHPASELTNGAMRRTSSEYFAFCSTHHIPDSTDLVVVELDVDDRANQEAQDNFEVLIRSILIRPDAPAVLLLGHFSPETHAVYGYSGPDSIHSTVAQFYDVPHISIKPMVYHDYMQSPDSIAKLYADQVLASPNGHELIAEALIAYVESQICTAWGVATGTSFDAVPLRSAFDPPAAGDGLGPLGGLGQRKGVPGAKEDSDNAAENAKLAGGAAHSSSSGTLPHGPLNVPRTRISTRPKADREFEEIAPFCVSANDLINPLPPSLFYGSGWHAYHPTTGSSSLHTKAHYFYSTLPTSKLRVPIMVGAGDVAVYYLKEPFSVVGEGSAVQCWVDDNVAGAKTMENAADVGDATAVLHYIDRFVSRGSHYVECQLMGEEGKGVPIFKIIGIFAT